MIASRNRPETTSSSPLECLCQDIPLSVLLGQSETSNKLPGGWEHPTQLQFDSGMDCYVFVVRSRSWAKAVYHEYWKGFAEVKVGDRILKVFTPEHLAVVKF